MLYAMMQHTLHFVDDEPAILDAIKRIFHRPNLQIGAAATSIRALRILYKTPVSVMESDYIKPEQTGAELGASQKYSSGYGSQLTQRQNDQAETIAAINQGSVFMILTKPFNENTLIRDVDAATAE